MKAWTAFIALAILFGTGVVADNIELGPGVGITLSSGYATISAYTENGSYIDIAKIEGSGSYKSYMLGQQHQSRHVSYSPKFCPLPDQICKRYWPFYSTDTTNPLAPILQALVKAAESTLEQQVRSVAVSTHELAVINQAADIQKDVQSALDDIQVSSWDRLAHEVPWIFQALGVQGRCSHGPYALPGDPGFHEGQVRLVLSVEYTRQSLVIGLWEEECGLASMIQSTYRPDLGHDAIERCRRAMHEDCDKAMTSAFRMVLRHDSRNPSQIIDDILLLGERANDDHMKTLLRQVLEEEYNNGADADLSTVNQFFIDPVYAGSRASALAEWGAKEGLCNRPDHSYHKEL